LAIDYHSPIEFERRHQSRHRDESTNLPTQPV
jgi:hypothetical protein